MSTITTRAGKGSPLTNTEMDNNLTNLNTDKLQSGDTAASLTITSADINGGTIDGTTIGGSTPSTAAFTETVITASGSTAALRVTNTGTGNSILVEDDTNPDSSPFVVKADGNVLIGTTTVASSNPKLGVNGALLIGNQSEAGTSGGLRLISASGSNWIQSGANALIGSVYDLKFTGMNGTPVHMTLDSTGNLGIGTTPSVKLDVYDATSSVLSVDGDSNTSIRSSRYSTDATAPAFNFRKARGTKASPTTVATSDFTANLQANAYDGTAFRVTATIASQVETYTTTDNVSGNLTFSTRPTGVAASTIERMRIDSSGNVGIGTTAPSAPLEVSGTVRFGSSNNVVSGGAQIQGKSTSNWNFGQLDLYRNSTNTANPRFIALMLDGDDRQSTTIGAYNAIWGAYDSSPTTSSTSAALNGAMVYAAYAGHRWVNNGTERMRIDSNGNVGIGTTTAYNKLDIITNGNANSVHLSNVANTDTGGYLNSTGNSELMLSGGASYNSYSAPNFVMNAKATVASGVYLTGDTIRFWVNTGLTAGTTFNQTERMRIDSSGNVGIGTASPSRKLQVISLGTEAIVASSGTADWTEIATWSGTSNEVKGQFQSIAGASLKVIFGSRSNHPVAFNTNDTERMRIDSSGNVGIGTASPTSGYKLDVAGNFKVSGSINENVYAVVDAAGVALTPQNGTIQTWTLGASRTPTSGTWAAGESMTLMINDGTAFTITWTTLGVVWVGGVAPTLALTGFTVIQLWKVSTTIYGALVGNVA